MDSLLEKIAGYNNIFIFGSGNVGRHIYQQLISDKVTATIRFCDNFRYGEHVLGAEVLKPIDAHKNFPDALFIVGSIIHFAPMHQQLRDMVSLIKISLHSGSKQKAE